MSRDSIETEKKIYNLEARLEMNLVFREFHHGNTHNVPFALFIQLRAESVFLLALNEDLDQRGGHHG